MCVSRADKSVKIWRNLPISNPNSDVHNTDAHTKFGENPLIITQVIIQKQKYGQITASKFDEICPLAIPNEISTISMHIPNLVKIHWCLLKLLSGNKKRMDGRTYDWRTDGRTDRHTDLQSETIIPNHYCVVGYCVVGYEVYTNEEHLRYIHIQVFLSILFCSIKCYI